VETPCGRCCCSETRNCDIGSTPSANPALSSGACNGRSPGAIK
jgi:hypothetical protein